ncbi:putative TATA box-binding protein-associated factor RNA polymerase I subunit A [Helianthus annuus]|nr:putative TATA box-binding protein-associated factor RNA polymerase I subunit A [Helianthus annuus]
MEDFMEIDEKEHTDEPKKTKTKKRKQTKTEDDVVVASSMKMKIKGIILSVTKPSYTLKRGLGRELRSLRSEHRNRLRYLLRQLVRRQNWDEACGVLSLLLKGTYKESGLVNNRIKYWATLKLLEHMKAAKLEPKAVLNVYDVWAKKDCAATKNKRQLKGRLDVKSELLLIFLLRGDFSMANDAVISLQQESDFSSNSIANLVAGLAFSHRWYNAIQKEVSLHDTLESSSPTQSVMSGTHEIILTNHSNGQSAVEVQDSGSVLQPDSNTSVRIGKEGVDQDRKVVPMEVDRVPKKEILEYDELDMNSDESGQNGNLSRFVHTGNKIYGSIVDATDLEDLLMPIKLPRMNYEELISLQRSIQNDHYKVAVKLLQDALHSTPPAFEALLPLIQMLLFGDQVKEAIEEVESIVKNSHAALPFRLKASLLEHFSKEDANKLSICFEDALRKDPTCSRSLAKLISLHHAVPGDYSIERLVEMIALHLDATYAGCDIWKEFASCFIELSRCDDDRMSSCVNSYGDSHTEISKNIPDMFQEEVSSKNWRLRCRWWLTRHFTQTILASEVTSGNFELVAYKAASACHLYGPEFAYVVTARRYLKREKRQEILILKEHMENAIGFTQHNTRSWASSDV